MFTTDIERFTTVVNFNEIELDIIANMTDLVEQLQRRPTIYKYE